MSDKSKVDLHICSGVLLNELYVLTSGNCIISAAGGQYELFAVEYGSNDLVKAYNKDKYVEVEKVIFHPEFNNMWPEVWNDIGS